MLAVAYWFFINAVKENAFYFLVITVLYSYIAISYVVIDLLMKIDDIGAIYIGALYFIASGIGLIRFLMHYNKKLKQDAGI